MIKILLLLLFMHAAKERVLSSSFIHSFISISLFLWKMSHGQQP